MYYYIKQIIIIRYIMIINIYNICWMKYHNRNTYKIYKNKYESN